ncbi:MAG: DUF4926 domain-containing protein [Clostridiales Family XIII bacterium]|jgi:hypothetical protein|nr:DUF4926 domain-containing protein [Clostridiales Family XIII bacterium]
MNRFKELDIVRLKTSRPDLGIDTRHQGAIVDVLNNGEAFTVEFIDDNHETIEDSLWAEFKPEELIFVMSDKIERVNVA